MMKIHSWPFSNFRTLTQQKSIRAVLTWGTYVYIEFIQNSKKSSPCGIFSFILYLLANFCFNLINWIKNENEIFSRMPPGLVSNCFFFRFHRETQSRSTPNVQIMKLKFFIVWSTSDKITSFHSRGTHTPHIAEWWIKHIMKIKVDLRSKRWWWGNARNISN